MIKFLLRLKSKLFGSSENQLQLALNFLSTRKGGVSVTDFMVHLVRQNDYSLDRRRGPLALQDKAKQAWACFPDLGLVTGNHGFEGSILSKAWCS